MKPLLKFLQVNHKVHIKSDINRNINFFNCKLLANKIPRSKRISTTKYNLNEDDLSGLVSNSHSITTQTSTQQRPSRVRVSDILNMMEPKIFTISENSTIIEAISHVIKQKLASALAVNSTNEITGIFTARDLLRCVEEQSLDIDNRKRRGSNKEDNLLSNIKVKDIMTKKDKLIYCSPNDSSRHCREIMFQCRIRNLPVIENGEVKGIITAKLLADSSFNLIDTGGKKGFIHNVLGRKGLPAGTKINQESLQRRNELQGGGLGSSSSQGGVVFKLDMEVGSYALPHPFKKESGVAMNRRLFGAGDLSEDLSLCEDAHFALKINSATTTSTSYIYLCVADGVGSWRQFGIDPRSFSHRLVENALKTIEADIAHQEIMDHSPFDRDLDPIHPLDVIVDAWNLTTSQGIVGSSTICVATLDRKLGQLSYSNLGDCGLMVLRHIDSGTAGYMRERQLPRHLRKNDLKIAYLSQQQLRSFNLPYQLGYSDIPNTPNSFENPNDADTASIPIMAGDIIILATDGLFDNIDLDEIVEEVSEWEIRSGGSEDIQSLAKTLVIKARELSLDKHRDSPFAILAKENDIMWGGGMPDDTSVVVARVVVNNNIQHNNLIT